MSSPSRQGIRAKLEKRREDNRERMRREEEAMDAFAVRAVQSLTAGQQGVVQDAEPWRLQASPETTPVEPTSAGGTDARRAIEARRRRPASSSPAPERGEPPLHAALRGIVADYAQPVTPSERTVTDLEKSSEIARDEADAYSLWAELELGEVLGVRAAIESVVQVVTNRVESIIIAELVAAHEHLASEYPEAPRPDPGTDDEW